MDFFELTPLETIESLEKQSYQRAQVVLKHSTRCIVSSMALKTLHHCDADADCWVLDLLRYRELSNEIALRYGILHESPQIIILREGTVQSFASHEKITCELIKTLHA